MSTTTTTSSALHPELNNVLTELRKKRNFNVHQWIEQKTSLFNKWANANTLNAFVLNMSGGIDSSVTAALLKHAERQTDSPIQQVLAIAQPIHSTPEIQNRAFEVSSEMNLDCITVDSSDIHSLYTNRIDSVLQPFHQAPGKDKNACQFAAGQLRSYLRTPVAYYVAQVFSANGLPCAVVGTGNYDEDGYLAYFCKAGDGICDVQLINDLHKSEVFQVGEALNLPRSVLDAKPSADLWEGQTDEEELGFSYDFVELLTELFLIHDTVENQLRFIEQRCHSPEARSQFISLFQKAEKVHRRNAHKFNFPVNLNILPTFSDHSKK